MIEEAKQEEPQEELEDEYEATEIVYESYISAAYYALNSVDDIDLEMVSTTEKNRIRAIKRKSIRIIHECISVMYDELFGEEET
jgi:hypothetical protein